MSHPTRKQWQHMVDQAHQLLQHLEVAGPPLFDRDRHTAQPDGYPSSSMGGDGRSSGGINRPTETAALTEPRRDQVHHDAIATATAMRLAIDALNAGVGCTQHAARLAVDQPDDHGPAGRCEACQRIVEGTAADRLRSGYCDACRQAWVRADRPDRNRFERERRQEPAA